MKTVYWSPFSIMEEYPRHQLLYDAPNLLENTKNTFVLRLPFEVAFALDADLGVFPIGQEYENNVEFIEIKKPLTLNTYTFAIKGNLIFWSEKPLTITTSSAHYHNPVFDGYYVGESFDIGKSFRPIKGTIQLNKGVNTVFIKRNDPIAYVKFNTKRSVELKRFYMSEELQQLILSGVKCKSNVITQEIKRNVVD
jgi:hypothetical protein